MHPQHRTAGQPAQDLPVVALTLGDPAGIGPELIARLLARPEAGQLANVVLIGDPWLWEAGQRIAGVRVALDPVDSFAARGRPATGRAAWLAMDTVRPGDVSPGQAGRPAAHRCCARWTPAWTRRWPATSTPSASRR